MPLQHLSLTGGTIAYDLTGPADGPLVICVHGLGDTRASYRFLAPKLAESGYRVAAMDVRGHGDSSTRWPEYSTPAVADDISALINRLGGPAILIGHSFAAGSSAMVAARTPEAVDRLVLIGPAVHHRPLRFPLKQVVTMVTSNPTLWSKFYQSLYPGPKPADFTQYLYDMRAGLRRPGRMAAVKRLMQSFGPDTDVDLSTVDTPALIVMGENDRDFNDPAKEADRIARSLAGSEVRLIPRSGHYPHVDTPDRTGTLITDYLAR